MYETFTHLATNTSGDLKTAHAAEAERCRRMCGDDWEGLAQTWEAFLSPIAAERTLGPADLDTTHTLVGPHPVDGDLSEVIRERLGKMPHRGSSADNILVEAIPYRDEDDTPGWFFYGWSRDF